MKRKIDRYFKNKLDTPQQPPADAWKFIQQHLAQKEKKRFIPFWAKISGIAALLLLLVGAGFMLDNIQFNTDLKPDSDLSNSGRSNIVVNSEGTSESSNGNLEPNQTTNHSENKDQKISSDQENNSFVYKKQFLNEDYENNPKLSTTRSKSNTYLDKSIYLNLSNQEKLSETTNSEKPANLLNEKENPDLLTFSQQPDWNPDPWNPETSIIEKKLTETLLFDISELEKTENEKLLAVNSKQDKKKKSFKNTKKKIEFDRFYISGFISPMALNSFVGNSMLADEMGQYKTENNVTLSYGVKGAYALSPRVKIRTGVTVTGFEQITKNVPLSASIENSAVSSFYGNINHNNNNIRYNGELRIESAHAASITGDELNHKSLEGNIQQQSQYIEIPIEAEIALFQTNSIGISATGGGSTWLLSKNKIYAHTDDYTEELGKADNLNKTSFSANAGLKFDMKIMDKVHLNVEPNFKYLINPVNDVEKFNPYTVGVNAGVTVSLK